MNTRSKSKTSARTGGRLLLASAAIALIGMLPLLMFLWLSPADQVPPIGLVLLAIGAFLACLAGRGLRSIEETVRRRLRRH